MNAFIRRFFTVIVFLLGIMLLPLRPVYASNDCPNGATLNIVAHEDDDLLFINPDIRNDILSGRCVITAYVTTGDAGQGSTYWTGRENGEKTAYAFMNGLPSSWNVSDAGISSHPIPVFTLNGSAKTKLVFLRLPDGNYDGTGFPTNNYQSLQKLWQGSISSITTVDGTSSYTKQALISTLATLMNIYQPDIIRTQNFVDPYDSSVDHSDHYTAAYATLSAHAVYDTSHLLIGYYDYEINSQPQNIFGTNATAKQDSFINYAQYDPLVCQTLSACQSTKYGGWFLREYPVATITPDLTPTLTPTPTQTGTNIAPTGTGYRWSQMTTVTGDSNRTPAPGMNDGDLTTDMRLNGGADDNSNAYEAAGIIWNTDQTSITRISFVNGGWDSSLNGAFTANFDLQTSVDGTTWKSSGLVPDTSYAYDSSSVAGKTYTFTGSIQEPLRGIRIVGQVHTNRARSWYANAREIRIEQGTSIETPTPTPSLTPAPTPVISGSNIAPLGTSFRWSQLSTKTSSSNKVAESKLTDGDITGDVRLNGGPDDAVNAYEAAGVTWSNGQSGIRRVTFINGSFEPSENGAFTANLSLQGTTDGTNWTDTGIQLTTVYPYDTPSVSGEAYTFEGILPDNILGVRVIGQVHTGSARSWYASVREVRVETGDSSNPPTPTPIPTISVTPTPTPTPGPSTGDLLSGTTWNLSNANGAAEEDKALSTTFSGKTSVTIMYNLHGASFGSGSDEASIIFIQNNTWFAKNIISYGTNGSSSIQSVTIPLSAFIQTGGAAILDGTKPVSNLHTRFWNSGSFSVDILGITVQ